MVNRLIHMPAIDLVLLKSQKCKSYIREQARKRAVIPARPVRRGFRVPFFVSFLGKQKRKKQIHLLYAYHFEMNNHYQLALAKVT